QFFRALANVQVIPSAVTVVEDDTGSPGDDDLHLRLQQLPRPRIGVIGRLSPEKGQDIFLRAAALLSGRGVGYSALLAGDGPARAGLTSLAASLGISDRTCFLG